MRRGQQAKNLLKRGIRAAIVGTSPLFPSPGSTASRILTYHSIGHRRYEMNVTPEAFAEQMAWLAAKHRVITLEAAAEGAPGVAITFDDGYADNLVNALPILEHHKLPATIFVVSGHLGQSRPGEKEPETGRIMTPEELREIHRRGVAIGAHTVNHPHLAALTPVEQAREIQESKRTLEEILGKPVPAFAYPYGSALDFTEQTERLVAEAGYSFACANQYGHNSPPRNRWALRRIWIDSTDSLRSFQDKVNGRLDAMAWQDSGLGIRLRRLLNRGFGTT